MKGVIFLILCLMKISYAALPQGHKKVLSRVEYYSNIFGHIHKNPSRYSQSLTTIECGHPVKVYHLVDKKNPKSRLEKFNRDFYYVKAGPYEGYIDQKYLSPQKSTCIQDRFPRFFDYLDLSVTEMYYWGKVYDHYLIGKSRVR